MSDGNAALIGSEPWWFAVAVIVAGWLVWLLAPVLTPFVAGALIGYLGDPPVGRLQRLGLGRTAAVCVVFAAMLALLAGLLLLLIPLVEAQVTQLLRRLPAYLEWIQSHLRPWFDERVGPGAGLPGAEQLVAALREHWQSAGGIAASVLGSVTRSGVALLGLLMNLLLIPVVAFYFMRDWDRLTAGLLGLLPRRLQPTAKRLAQESDQVLGAFLRGQLLVMLALGLFYAAGLWIAGLDLAFLVGMLAGLVSFVPYLGFIVGATAACIAALVQFQELLPLAWVLLVFGAGQVLESVALTPLLVGDRIGLHPVAVVFAVLAGGQLFGFLGVLLALPVAAVVMVLVREAHRRYRDSALYRRDSPADTGGAA